MDISKEELADIETLKKRQSDIKIRAFDLMVAYMKLTVEDLVKSGHRHGVGEALKTSMTRAMDDIQKEEAKFLKKWPD
jgi:hypothetical protein